MNIHLSLRLRNLMSTLGWLRCVESAFDHRFKTIRDHDNTPLQGTSDWIGKLIKGDQGSFTDDINGTLGEGGVASILPGPLSCYEKIQPGHYWDPIARKKETASIDFEGASGDALYPSIGVRATDCLPSNREPHLLIRSTDDKTIEHAFLRIHPCGSKVEIYGSTLNMDVTEPRFKKKGQELFPSNKPDFAIHWKELTPWDPNRFGPPIDGDMLEGHLDFFLKERLQQNIARGCLEKTDIDFFQAKLSGIPLDLPKRLFSHELFVALTKDVRQF